MENDLSQIRFIIISMYFFTIYSIFLYFLLVLNLIKKIYTILTNWKTHIKTHIAFNNNSYTNSNTHTSIK